MFTFRNMYDVHCPVHCPVLYTLHMLQMIIIIMCNVYNIQSTGHPDVNEQCSLCRKLKIGHVVQYGNCNIFEFDFIFSTRYFMLFTVYHKFSAFFETLENAAFLLNFFESIRLYAMINAAQVPNTLKVK